MSNAISLQVVREAVKDLRSARDDLDMLATDGRLAHLPMNNSASALDWAGTALCNLRSALARLDRGIGEVGSIAVETALVFAVLTPVALYCGGIVGPAALDWTERAYGRVQAGGEALNGLCEALEQVDAEPIQACEGVTW